MKMVNVHAAKTQLSRLLAEMEAGEQVVIARKGVPVARLVPYEEATAAPPRREIGSESAAIRVLDAPAEPSSEAEWKDWAEEWDSFLGPDR